MPSQKYATRGLSSHGSNCCSESLLVAFRAAPLWWPVGSQLAEWEIAAEDGQPGGAESIRHRHEKGRIAVRSRTVRQNKAIPNRIGWEVQKPSNWYFTVCSVEKFSVIAHIYGPL